MSGATPMGHQGVEKGRPPEPAAPAAAEKGLADGPGQVRLTCICCPVGCELVAVMRGAEVAEVSGNQCPRGAAYARAELTDPRRTVTGTVRVRGGAWPVTSVKTVPDVPRGAVMDVARAFRALEAEAPVALGDVLCEDVCGTGSAVVVTKSVEKGTGVFST